MFSILFNLYAEALQVPKEMRIAFGDMFNAGEREAAATAQSDDCKGHEQTMVVVTIDDYTTFDTWGRPCTKMASRRGVTAQPARCNSRHRSSIRSDSL